MAARWLEAVAADDAATSELPAPLRQWVEGLLGELPPAERHARCSRCAMCAQADQDAPPAQRITFDPSVRCCTYRPPLANHLVGRLLREPVPHESLAARVAAGEATPLGLRVAPPYQLLYRHARTASFGRAESLRCPHQGGDGRCAIWSHRPGVCATWFCKHERGAVGARQWTALRECLAAAERALALWCLQQLGWSGERRREALTAHDADLFEAQALDGRTDAASQRRLWGDWWGHELQFYRRCAEWVEPLDWSAIERIGGAELASLAAAAREAAAAHVDPALPAALAAGRFGVVGAHQGRLCLQSYSEFDPLEVSPDVLALVARCDGREAGAIVAEHVAQGGRRPDRRLLRTLVDFGVLEGVPSQADTGPPDGRKPD